MSANLFDIATSGDRLETLKSLRDKLAKAIDESKSGRDLASLSRQMTEVLAQISLIENSGPGAEVTIFESIYLRHHQEEAKAETPKPTQRKSRAKDKT